MGEPAVSVIVPVRDRRTMLRQLLDALWAQAFSNFEVVVVDDGSTDGSPDEVEADARAGRPVRLVHGPGTGAVAARQAGVAVARGAVLAFTDSDCVPRPEWLAAGVAAVAAGADVVVGPTRPVRHIRSGERSLWSAGTDGLYRTCNVFYRRSAYESVGGFADGWDRFGFRPDESARRLGFGEDTLLGWEVARAGRATVADAAVVEHQVFPPDRTDTLRRAWMAGGFPALVRAVPELRVTLLRHRVFLGRQRVPLYLGVAALGARRRAPAALALAWWVAWTARRMYAADPAARRVLAALPDELLTDAVFAVALLAGSARARSVVL